MQDKKYSLTQAVVNSNSPIHTPPKVVSEPGVELESESTVVNTFE